MFIRSTGLGRTLLTARVANIQTTTMVPSTLDPPGAGATEPMRMLMVMEVVHPVHWTVRAFVEPADLRRMAKLVLTNPALILKAIKFFFSKGPVHEGPQSEVGAPAPAMGQTAPAPSQSTRAPVTAPAASYAKGPGPIPPPPPKRGPGPIPPRRQ